MANEKIALTAPVTQPPLSDFRRGSLLLQDEPVPRIVVTVIRNSDNRGEVFEYPAPGTSLDTSAKVAAILENFNSSDNTTTSVWRKVMGKLKADFPARFPGATTVQ